MRSNIKKEPPVKHIAISLTTGHLNIVADAARRNF